MPAEVQQHSPWPRTCPHCGKQIRRLARRPRDLGLLLNALIYRVPIQNKITEFWIETARKHCRMTPERLAALRTGDHARHWPRMVERRAARLAYFKKHGQEPPAWLGLLPGEHDHGAQLAGLRLYRKGGLAKFKAKLRKHPNTVMQKLQSRLLATKRIRSRNRRAAAVNDVMTRFIAQTQANKLTVHEFQVLKGSVLPDSALPRRFRRKDKTTHLGAELVIKNAGEELHSKLPEPPPEEG